MSALTDEAVVDIQELHKRYGGIAAVNDLSFRLARRSITALLGPNGAGKSTTFRALLGLAEPSHGAALIFGRRYRDLEHPARLVGAVLESNDFHPGRSGRNHLRALAGTADAGISAARVEKVLQLVGLGDAADRRVGTYSLGMRQRLGLAGALLGEPELLILDEPANGLDPAGIHWLREFLRSFASGGGTVLLASHVLAEVAQTVDEALVMDRGRLAGRFAMHELAGRGTTLESAYLDLTAGGAA